MATSGYLIAAHVGSMLGFATYAANLVLLKTLWGLSNTEAGAVAGAFFLGYMVCVPMWTAMTDRRDARLVYSLGCLLSAAGSLGFGLFATGLASAVLFQLALGAGISATYMPGLRILSERLSGATQSRHVGFYTASFGIGVAGSLLLAGWATPALGWRWAFGLAAIGPMAALGVVWYATRHDPGPRFAGAPPISGRGLGAMFERLFPVAAWRAALGVQPVLGYTLGYAVHCLELFGSRAWTVAFLVFAGSMRGGENAPLEAAAMASIVNLLSTPASIIGNEIALKIGRRAWIVLVMASGSVVGVWMSLLAGSTWWLVLSLLSLHSMLLMADSASLTAGLVANSPPDIKGAAMGLYSFVGFGAAALGPTLFGFALDLAGGATRPWAWATAFLAIGLGCLAYPLIDRLVFRSSPFAARASGPTSSGEHEAPATPRDRDDC